MRKLFLYTLVSIILPMQTALWLHIDWEDDTHIYAQYDEKKQTLTLQPSITLSKDPKTLYTASMQIQNYECETELTYKSFRIKGFCDFEIWEENIEWIYKVSIQIKDETDEEVYNDFYEVKIPKYESSFSWNDFETEIIEDEKNWKKTLKWYIKDDLSELYHGYKIVIASPYNANGDNQYWDPQAARFKQPKYTTLDLKYDKNDSSIYFLFDTDKVYLDSKYERLNYKIFKVNVKTGMVWISDKNWNITTFHKSDNFLKNPEQYLKNNKN